jgi:replicative DNA helicase
MAEVHDKTASEPRADVRPREARTKAATASPTREPPHNKELERSVLSVLLDGRHATAIHKIRTVIEHPLGFFQRDHRIIYLACLELDDAGHRIDAGAVAELLSRYDFKAVLERLRNQQLLLDSDQLDRLGRARLRALYQRTDADLAAQFEDSALQAIGGFNAVNDLLDAVAPVSSLERNVGLLWDYYLKRRYISRLQTLCDKAYRTPENFTQLIDESGQAILDLGRFNKSATVHGISTVVDETLDDIQAHINNPEVGVKTGIADVDDKLMSLRPGGLYILAARPGVGKTSLALKIVAHIAGHSEERNGVLFFSLEVDRKDLVKKLLSAEARVEFKSLENGTLGSSDMESLAETAKNFKDWMLDLMDVSDLTVQSLRSITRRRMLETNNKLKLVVLDYLQLLNTARTDSNEYEKVSEISRVLKVMARELRIPVLALSQMSRESEKGVGSAPREPRLSDLRGSGSIEQDADAVLFIHRTDAADGGQSQRNEGEECRKIKVIVAKNRFGPTGSANMNFFPAKMRFEMAPRDAQDDSSEANYQHDKRARHGSQPNQDEDLFG